MTEQHYECEACGHQIKIHQREEQAVICQCTDEGWPMNPVDE